MSTIDQEFTFYDLFCGCGGSTKGAVAAGAKPAAGLNHWQTACDTWEANHAHVAPGAQAHCADVVSIDPRSLPPARMLLASPECTHHSYARGRPKDDASLFDPKGDKAAERSRATMWDVPRFAEAHDYDVIVVENVVEVLKWGPRTTPGALFNAWLIAMEGLGYRWRKLCLNAQFFGVPQSRDRLFVVFWKKGLRDPDLDFEPLALCPQCRSLCYGIQRWKNPAKPEGRYGVQYDYACPTCHGKVNPAITPARHAIDWSLPITRIGDRAKPLRPATMKRIERGLRKLGDRPMVVPLSRLTTLGGLDLSKDPRSTEGPMPTQTTRQDQGLVVQVAGNLFARGESATRTRTLDEPQHTCHTTMDRALVVAAGGNPVEARAAEKPSPTVVGSDRLGLVLSNMNNNVPRVAHEEAAHPATTGGKLALIVPGRENAVPRPVDGPSPTATTITSLYLLDPLDAAIVPFRKHTEPRHVDGEVAHTVTSDGNHHGLVVSNYGLSKERQDQGQLGGWERDADAEPFGTITTTDGHALAEFPVPDHAVVAYERQDHEVRGADEPAPAVTTVQRHALLATDVAVEDCGFRMFEPHEIGRVQAFEEAYQVFGNKRERVKQYGNAVPAPIMEWIVGRLKAALEG